MLASLIRWLRGWLHRPLGLAFAAIIPTLLFGWLFWYELTAPHPWETLLRRGEMAANTYLRTHGRAASLRPDLVYLGVDDATMELDGMWPDEIESSRALTLISQAKGYANWSREIDALILDRLVGAGAKLVIFDMVFPHPATGDEAFRAALDRHHDKVVIGASFEHTEFIGTDGTQTGVHDDRWKGPTNTLIDDPANDRRVGYVNYLADFDDAIRMHLFRITQAAYNKRWPEPGDHVYESEIARALQQMGWGDAVPPGAELFRYSDLGHGVDYPPRPLWEIFLDSTWKQNYGDGAFFKDKIVIVGAASAILHDVQQTPFGEIPGPALQLQVLAAAMNRDYLKVTGGWTDLGMIAGAGVLAWIVGLVLRSPLWRLGALAAGSGLFVLLVQWLYNRHGLMPLAFTPLLAYNLSGLGGLIGEYAVERAEKARVRGVLDRLVSKDIVRELLGDRERYTQLVRGQRRPVTVLFSDVRGFTTLSEQAADPAAFIAQLNEYLSEMVEIVFKHRGTLDKFIGDAVMAVWGSMHTDGVEEDARHAVAAALDMRERLAALNARWASEGKLQLAFGIGINHGDVIVGGLGDEKNKMEITVMGDAVNTASRLEGLTKDYHLDLLIGESVAAKVSEVFRLRTVDLVQVKGKTRATEVMTVAGRLDEAVPLEREELLADYEDAILRFRKRDFAGAAKGLEACLQNDPADVLAQLYLQRCHDLLDQPPEENWSGVRLMLTK